MQDLDPRLLEEIRRQLEDGQKIEAIKHAREVTGLGLAEAKSLVEDIERGETPSMPGRQSSRSGHRPGVGLPLEVQKLLREGKKIEAIRGLREDSGLGLKDAHDEVEAFLQQNPDLRPESGAGKTIAIVVVVALALAGWWLSRLMQGNNF